MTIPTLDECRPGLNPMEYNVLIAGPPVTGGETKRPSGLIVLQETADAEAAGSMRGRLVAVSPLAFTYETWPAGTRLPTVGDEVIHAKFAGVLVIGADGREYRVAKDRDIIAVVTEN